MAFSLCPTNASVPIVASGIIPVDDSDVSGIPPIALVIPDFEGQAILRIFSNDTESEIGCYSAVVTNGNTFSQPAAVAPILGVFTFVALIASLATAVYGNHIPTTRLHYAHSLSIFVVFSVFHHIFYTGALSINWPSVLPAFWSNFAWSAGMIYSQQMQESINHLIGSNLGNTSSVGAAGSGPSSDNVGGGYSISSIYKRIIGNSIGRDMATDGATIFPKRSSDISPPIFKRALENSSDGYSWYGRPVTAGLPLPGNYSGFAGTLSAENIPASNAFMTGFLWFLIVAVVAATSVVLFKWVLEGLSKIKMIKQDRLTFFRAHWLGFTRSVLLRTTLIGFFMMIFLTLFQFTYKGSAGVTAIAAIMFLIFFVGLLGIAVFACYYRLKNRRYAVVSDRLHLEGKRVLGFVPWLAFTRESQRSEKSDPNPSIGSLPWWRLTYSCNDSQVTEIHQDEDFNKKFGWLSARFRRTRWWFFSVWLVYEFIRACFYGGAAGHPLIQVFGLLIVEFIALITIIVARPFEGARLNALMVYLLGFSKVATLALSAAFDARFNLPRIITTAIGIIIIVIQGLLVIALLIMILIGAVSSYFSITRDHTQEDFRPRHWAPLRKKYFTHIERAALDRPPSPPPPPEEPKEPYFNVGSVRRLPKIEDEGDDPVGDFNDINGSSVSIAGPATVRGSRANSMRSNVSATNLPFGARPHRTSWSSRDFSNWHDGSNRNSELMSRNGMQNMKSDGSLRDAFQQRSRAPSRGATFPLEVKKSRNGKEKEVVPLLKERPSMSVDPVEEAADEGSTQK